MEASPLIHAFRPIELARDRDTVITFRKDSFRVSFGHLDDMPADEAYLSWLAEKMARFPGGFVLALDAAGRPVGQIEMQLREQDGQPVGYVNLYYLLPELRGRGHGQQLHAYSLRFFREHGARSYFLTVSPTNAPAIRFYEKQGMSRAGLEREGKLLRMIGPVPPEPGGQNVR